MDGNINMLITNENFNRIAEEIQSRLLVKYPYVNVSCGFLSGTTIFIKVSTESKGEWSNGYIENSPGILISLDNDVLKMVYRYGKHIGNKQMLKIKKLRKSKVKSIDDIVNKILKLETEVIELPF